MKCRMGRHSWFGVIVGALVGITILVGTQKFSPAETVPSGPAGNSSGSTTEQPSSPTAPAVAAASQGSDLILTAPEGPSLSGQELAPPPTAVFEPVPPSSLVAPAAVRPIAALPRSPADGAGMGNLLGVRTAPVQVAQEKLPKPLAKDAAPKKADAAWASDLDPLGLLPATLTTAKEGEGAEGSKKVQGEQHETEAVSSGPAPMHQIGLFWFRDNTAEIAGRGPYRPDMPAMEHKITEGVFMGGPENGLTWQSADKYFGLTFHNLTQLDEREPLQQGDPLHGGFIIPRQRWYFEGKVGDYTTFVTSVNRGYASFDVLDSYVNYIVHPEYLEFRVGRMKTPSQYEYISIDEANLIGPERSIYVQSFAGNRQLGAMAHGRLFERHLEYYAGIFNGQRRSFEDFNSSRDFYFYLDYRPFITSGIAGLEGLHMVGTTNFGIERQPLSPIALRTMNQLSNSAAAAFVSPTIMEFNNNAFENGPRQFFSYETVYYYKSVGFLAGVQGGYQDYSTGNLNPFPNRQDASTEFLGVSSANRTHVPIYGWSVQGWWFLTGEEITRRRYLVEPVNPFGYYNGKINSGAIELFAKVSNLQLGNSVFSGGIANGAMWSNRATSPEIGINWYLTHFVKFTFDYQHTFLGNPVFLTPDGSKRTKDYDLFMFRTQLFF